MRTVAMGTAGGISGYASATSKISILANFSHQIKRALSNLLVICEFTMLLAYIIATLALFIGWIKNISIIATKPWIERCFFLTSTVLLIWCSLRVVNQTNHLSDNLAFMYLAYYFGYLLLLSVIFYNLVNFLSKKLR